MFDLESIKIWLGIAGFILLVVVASDIRSCTDRLMGRPTPPSGMAERADLKSQERVRVAQDVVKEALIKEAKTSGKPQSREVGNLVLTAYPDGTTSSVAVATGASSAPAAQGDWWPGIITLSYVMLGIVVIIFVVAPILQRILKSTPS